MKTVIYVDVLLAVNLLITYTLLLLTCAVLKLFPDKRRILIGAILGSIYSLVILTPKISFIVALLLKLFMCISIVCVSFQLKKLRIIFKFSVSFFAVNIAFSGLLLLIVNIFNTNFILVQNVNVYMNIGFPLLFALTCCGYIVLKFIIKLFQHTPSNSLYRVRIHFDGITIETTAVADSGNSLYEPISGKPVCVLYKDVLLQMLPKNIQLFTEEILNAGHNLDSCADTRAVVIFAKFAAGNTLLPAIKVDMLEIINEKNSLKYENCLIALTDNSFSEMNCQMLLHPSLLNNNITQEVCYEKCDW